MNKIKIMEYSNWNKKIAYYFDEDIGTFNYAQGHPMKPFRVKMTDNLMRAYHLDEKVNHFVKKFFFFLFLINFFTY